MNIRPPLREVGRQQWHPKEGIEDSIQGVSFDYYYTGMREGPSGQIELHITSVVRDWQENIYTRKAWFLGNKEKWKECIQSFIRDHLHDLDTGTLLVKRMMRDFEVSHDKYTPWDQYNPVRFGMYD